MYFKKLFWAVAPLILISSTISAQQFVWSKAIAGGAKESLSGLEVDTNGHIVGCGIFKKNITINPNSGVTKTTYGNEDIFLFKQSQDGRFLWQKQIGGTASDQVSDLCLDAAGSPIICGNFLGRCGFDPGYATYEMTASGISPDAFICKLDKEGEFLWAKRFGDEASCYATAVSCDEAGNLYVVGTLLGKTDMNPDSAETFLTPKGNNDVYLSKFSGNGEWIWSKLIGGSMYESAMDVKLDQKGNVYLLGSFTGTVDFDPGPAVANLMADEWGNLFLCCLSSEGKYRWAVQWGGKSYDSPSALAIDEAGNVLVSGSFAGTADLKPGEGTLSVVANGTYDAFVSKVDSNGKFIWTQSWKEANEFDIRSQIVDKSGNIYLCGRFMLSVDADPSLSGSDSLKSQGTDDAFLLALDANGKYLWSEQIGGVNEEWDVFGKARKDIFFDSGTHLAIDRKSNLIWGGYFSDIIDLNPGEAVEKKYASGTKSDDTDIFIFKYRTIPK